MSFKAYVITKTAYEDIKKLDNATKKKLKDRLEFLLILDDPLSRAVKLSDPRQGTYRWTIGDYRVIFDVHRRKVIILRVQHRGEIYKS
ncbi:type II toxin-antitoxin system RelE/ParE family toxin [Candidatus Saccharibacteria bacterium]|nr:type II toxin-antitoxin system RelE/ParE family toxin [Candidatus Saccharibacteria bacterium]